MSLPFPSLGSYLTLLVCFIRADKCMVRPCHDNRNAVLSLHHLPLPILDLRVGPSRDVVGRANQLPRFQYQHHSFPALKPNIQISYLSLFIYTLMADARRSRIMPSHFYDH
jgi:hypothetical protein